MGEAIMTARYLTNLTPTTVLNDKALSKIWNKKLAGYTNLKTFVMQPIFIRIQEKLSLKLRNLYFWVILKAPMDGAWKSSCPF